VNPQNLLLDTHVLLWWLNEPERLQTDARDAIADEGRLVFVSAASAWEVGIKMSVGKLRFTTDLEEMVANSRLEPLPVSLGHGFGVRDLPLLHRDPFDRILVAQAQIEGLTLATRDPKIQQYDVPVLMT
jgi:PIN domain nuclease of toxin-antitoxin system